MGARSDWNSAPVSENGDDTPAETTNGDDETDPAQPNGRRWTIFQDEELRKEKESADEHVQKYVQDQLKRLMSPDAPTQNEDEIEAKYDGM